MAIIRQFTGSVKDYLDRFADWAIVQPDEGCPICGTCGCFIKHGTYWRWACEVEEDTQIRIQRLLCQACRHTHAILPSFLHPFRHYTLTLIQDVIQRYLLAGTSYRQLMRSLGDTDRPPRRTLRNWLRDVAHGATLLFPTLSRAILTLDPFTTLPGTDEEPEHLRRVRDAAQRKRLTLAWRFLLAAEQFYALSKAHHPGLQFSAADLFPFLLHWLSSIDLAPRCLWDPTLATTPTDPF